VEYWEIITRFQQRAGVASREEAVRIVTAVVQTLSDCLDSKLATHLANQLPDALGDAARFSIRRERLSIDGFYDRVAVRADKPALKAASLSNAVMQVLREALTPQDMSSIAESLPQEYLEMLSAPGG